MLVHRIAAPDRREAWLGAYLRPYVRHWLGALCLVLVLGGCAPLISEYSLDAHKNATSLKAETLALIEKSGDKYAARKSEVDALSTKIDAAYEFAAGIPNNKLSAAQWNLLRNPNGNLYGGFVSLWAKQGTVSAAYRAGKAKEISDAFNQIICLEANKKEATTCSAAAAAAQ
jgi:hypothetical protein